MRRWLTVMLAVALAMGLGAGPALGQESTAKADKELTMEGRKIDKAAAGADAGQVTSRIVEEWSGTNFKFDATSDPRPLTAQDVQDLRAKGLGYGEISILLGLTANQPNPDTAKPLNEVLALRQGGKGWGEVATELGYKNLGSVMKSVKATEKGISQAAKAGKPEMGKPEKAKPEGLEKPGRQEKPGRVEKLQIDRPERAERPGRK